MQHTIWKFSCIDLANQYGKNNNRKLFFFFYFTIIIIYHRGTIQKRQKYLFRKQSCDGEFWGVTLDLVLLS